MKLDEINAIGHRLVHGGEKICQSVVIDNSVVEVLKEVAVKMNITSSTKNIKAKSSIHCLVLFV